MSSVPHAERIHGDGATPERWMLVLHGVFGSAANFRGIARRLARGRPDWGFVLADLRGHGRSPAATPPHTIASAARDLDRLPDRVRGVLGHSLGGKVALAFAEAHPDLDAVWILDSQPGAREPGRGPSSTTAVLETLESIAQPLPDRRSFAALVEPRFGRAIADWLAMSLRATEDGLRLVFDLPAIRAMLSDYYARDLWHVVDDGRRRDRTHFVVGGRSDVLSAADRDRLAQAVVVHVLAEAGHWIHSDDPDALVALLLANLPSS